MHSAMHDSLRSHIWTTINGTVVHLSSLMMCQSLAFHISNICSLLVGHRWLVCCQMVEKNIRQRIWWSFPKHFFQIRYVRYAFMIRISLCGNTYHLIRIDALPARNTVAWSITAGVWTKIYRTIWTTKTGDVSLHNCKRKFCLAVNWN